MHEGEIDGLNVGNAVGVADVGNADGAFVGPEGFAVGKGVGAVVFRGSELQGITST